MTKKNMYISGELPDGVLQDFEECRDAFLMLISKLSEKYSPRSIHAGLSKAHLGFLRLTGAENFKEIVKDTVEYYLTEAEKIEKKK